MRDPKQIKYLFEIYVPIVMAKGRQKIRNKANLLLKNKRPKVSAKSMKNDYMKQLRVEEILTDDSMKDIDYRDINSDFSDDMLNQIEPQSGGDKKKKKK